MATDDLSDLDLEILQDAIDTETAHDTEPKDSIIDRKKPSDEYCEAFVDRILETYPGFVSPSKHWTLTIMSMIHRLKFRPPSVIVANPHKYDPACGDLMIVQRHLSVSVLEQLEVAIAAAYTPETAVIQEPAEINENSYLERQVEVETGAASTDKEGWASW